MTTTAPPAKPRVTDERVKLRVLLKNKRMCCVCHSPEKGIQLHHIDGNPSETSDANLAVLCLPHPTPDGKAYVYGYRRMLSDLYVVDGLK